MAFLLRNGRRSSCIFTRISSIHTSSYNRPLHNISPALERGTAKTQQQENLLQANRSWNMQESLITVPWASWGYVRFYSHPSEQKGKENESKGGFEDFKHQEIEGPTVERDMSSLANETRQELDQMRKSIYDLSKAVLLLGLSQLTYGAGVLWVTKSSPFSEISVQSFFAFAFPFTFAYLLRHALKHMTFFTNLEGQGRLQILTLALQITKSLKSLFKILRGVAVLCAAGISVGLFAYVSSVPLKEGKS